MNKFTEESITYFFNERNNAKKEYDTKIAKLSNDFFADNNIPFKVGDKVKVIDNKVGTVISLYTDIYKYVHHYNYTPMIRVELDENKDLEYFAALSNIKKI